MLYFGLVFLIISITYLILSPCEGITLTTEEGKTVRVPIGCYPDQEGMLIGSLFLMGVIFTLIGSVYAIKEYRNN